MSFVLVGALSRRGQNAGPQAAGQVICGRHVGAEPVQRGGKQLLSVFFDMDRKLFEKKLSISSVLLKRQDIYVIWSYSSS